MSGQQRGTVYGSLMNFRSELEALGARMHEAPYKAPPQAPVLYVKPANTWSEHRAAIAVPAQAQTQAQAQAQTQTPELAIGATLAMVVGPNAELAGYVLMNDLCLPHDSFFRPPVKLNCLDGFLGIGPHICAADALGDPAALVLEVRINGQLVQTVQFAQLVRPAAQLLADVSAFMTLGPGDMLMLGCDVLRPRGRIGDRIDIAAPDCAALGTLSNTLVAEAA